MTDNEHAKKIIDASAALSAAMNAARQAGLMVEIKTLSCPDIKTGQDIESIDVAVSRKLTGQ